jgi:hypothetical protein
VLSIVGLAFVATAVAQDTPDEPEPLTPVLRPTEQPIFANDPVELPLRAPEPRFPEEYFKPEGLKFGTLEMYPTFKYELTYDDNPARSHLRPKADFVEDFFGGWGFKQEATPNISWRANYQFGYRDYARGVVDNYLTHRADGELVLTDVLTQGLEFGFGDNFSQSGNTDVLEANLLQFARYENNQAYSVVRYQFNRLTLSGRYAYGLVDYLRQQLSPADSNTHLGQVDAVYDLLPENRLAFFSSYQIVRTLRPHQTDQDFDAHTALAGIRGEYGKLDYSAGLGWSKSFGLQHDQQNEGPVAQARVLYRPQERMAFELEASRRFVPGVLTGASTETRLALTGDVRLTEHGHLFLRGGMTDIDPYKGNRFTAFVGDVGYRYHFTRFAALSAFYTRTGRTADVPDVRFTANQAHLSFTFAW